MKGSCCWSKVKGRWLSFSTHDTSEQLMRTTHTREPSYIITEKMTGGTCRKNFCIYHCCCACCSFLPVCVSLTAATLSFSLCSFCFSPLGLERAPTHKECYSTHAAPRNFAHAPRVNMLVVVPLFHIVCAYLCSYLGSSSKARRAPCNPNTAWLAGCHTAGDISYIQHSVTYPSCREQQRTCGSSPVNYYNAFVGQRVQQYGMICR